MKLSFNEQKKILRKRLSLLQPKVLKQLSKVSSEVMYTQGYTKYALTNVLRELEDTKNGRILFESIKDRVENYEYYQTWGIDGILDDIYNTSPAEIQQFMRIKDSQGWSKEQLLTAIETMYDTIMMLNSNEMVDMPVPDGEVVQDYFGE